MLPLGAFIRRYHPDFTHPTVNAGATLYFAILL